MNTTALITGGASGIGLELAKLMARDSYNLVLVDQSKELPDVKNKQLNINPGLNIKTIIKDLTEPDTAVKIYEELENGYKAMNRGKVVTIHRSVNYLSAISLISNLQVGDTVSFKGEYEWNEQGGLIHWTHHDPDGRHEPGWIKHGGRTYQ